MSEHVVYVDRFQIREGKVELCKRSSLIFKTKPQLADFKRYATEMAELVEENEPGALSFNYYVDEDGASGTAVFVFSDAEALDAHLDLAASRFQEGYELLSATEIEVLGRPSHRAIELARSFNAGLKTRFAGFSR